MEKSERIKELVEKLNRWSYEYYSLDNPSVSDKDYDKDYDELIKLEKETGIILPYSPTQRVGGKILDSFKKVQHKQKLWSLDKAQSFEELKNWLIRCETFVKEYNQTHKTKLPQLQYLILKKFDGLTLKCTYEGIDFDEGSTRGSGIEGEDVTEQCKTIINLPIQLKDNSKQTSFASYHGECLMSKKALIEYNKTTSEPLKNCRNGVAGAIRNLNPKETAKRKPMIYFYNINDIEGVEFQTYEQQLNYMEYRGLPVAEYIICNTYEEIVQAINNIEKERPNLPYEIDGSVIAINDLATRIAMGFTNKFPRYSLAYKYEAEETTTKLIGVEWNTSRLGRINPKGILEPVELCGSTVSKATLNNLDDIKRKNVKINSIVFTRKSNDVIPEITGVVDESLNNPDVYDIAPPSKCPKCGSETEIIDGFVWCTKIDCDARLVKSITHFVEKQALNIEGLAEKTVELLKEKGLIKSISDIYKLKNYKKEILQLPKFAIKKFNNLIESIEKSRDVKLGNFIYSLGIPNVGEVASSKLAEKFVSLDNMLNANRKNLLDIDDIGDTTADSILHYIKTNNELIDNLKQELNVIDYQTKETTQGVFSGKSLYCTGTFSCGNKDYLKELVESNGGTFTKGINKDLAYLVVGSLKGSGKEKQARDKGITVLQEEEFLQIIKGN